MTQYVWIFVVDNLEDDVIDSVYSTCDARVSRHADFTLLTVTTEGSTAVEAAKATILRLQSEMRLVRFLRPYEDLVTRVEIAARCGTTPQAVGQWILGKRRRKFPFPERSSLSAGGLWLWGEVDHWLRRTRKSSNDIEHPRREDYFSVNRWIHEQLLTHNPGCIYPVESTAKNHADFKRVHANSITNSDFHLVSLYFR